MSRNIGLIDRVMRIVIGVGLLAFAMRLGVSDTGWNWIGWIGVVPLLTAVVGFCPAYGVFGVSTCKR